MSETQLTAREIRAEAARLLQDADQDPHSVDPVTAGAIGYLLLDTLDETEPRFPSELDMALRLLRHGVAFAPANDLACSWRLALAIGHGHLANDGEFVEWTSALGWGEAAVTTARTSDEFIESVHELVALRMGRLDVLWQDKSVPQSDRMAELSETEVELARFRSEITEPAARAYLDIEAARLLATRYEVTENLDDYDRATELIVAAVSWLSEGDPDVPCGWALLADLRRMQYRATQDEAVLHAAVDAATLAVETTASADPARPDRHLLLARLIFLRNLLNDTPDRDDRDRVIEHLAIAVTGETDAETWELYGDVLCDRGTDNDNLEDLLAGVSWLTRYVEQQDASEEDAWLVWAALVNAHVELFRLTGEMAHADSIVEYSTWLLAYPQLDHAMVVEYHHRRLTSAFQDGNRPDLETYLLAWPVVVWLQDAQRTADDAGMSENPDTDMAALLSFTVAMSWFQMLIHAPHLVAARPAELLALLDTQVRLLERARTMTDVPDNFLLMLDFVTELLGNTSRITGGDGDAEFTVLKRLLADPDLADMHEDLLGLIGNLVPLVGTATGSLSALDAGIALYVKIAEDETVESGKRSEAEAMASFFQLIRHIYLRPEASDLYPLGRRAWELLSALPASPSIKPLLSSVESIVRPMAGVLGFESTDYTSTSGETDFWMSTLLEPIHLTHELISATENRDVVAVRKICGRLDRLDGGGPGLLPATAVRAMAYDNLSKMEPDNHEVLDVVIEGYSRYFADSQLDSSPLLAEQAAALCEALRRRRKPDDFVQSRRVGLEIVQNAGWRVLLQSSADQATEIARTALKTADQLTGWCLEDGAVADLIQVVDARRGLVLRSANTSRTVSAQLTAIGMVDLAAEWDAAGGLDEALLPDRRSVDVEWGALRRKVLRALTGVSDGLLAPLTVVELQSALRAQGSDVFAYLLPSCETHSATVIFVPVQGAPTVRTLPEMGTGKAVERYQKTYDAWDNADTGDGIEYDRWRTELTELCAWAWEAAAAEVLAFGHTCAEGRDPRIVLVPVGILGLVPWHAANRKIGEIDRYLIEDAAISYVPSGRLFCETVARPDVPGEKAVLVGNPARNLAAGAVEAMAIRDAFYESGVFLGGVGQPPRPWRQAENGAGTPDEVLDRLRGPVQLLHLACHAVADVRQPLHSTIELAGRPSAPLTAADLLELSLTRPLELGTVVLAGCTTHVSGVDYDEALSLASSFLAIGSRTVVGSMWRVPAGRSTVYLMFLFHHYLRHERVTPAEALRRAQICLLSPNVELPATMPARLRDTGENNFGATGIENWAGFAHQGR